MENTQFSQVHLEYNDKTYNSLKKFLYISTSSVYGEVVSGNENSPLKPVSPYGVTKLAGENLVVAYSKSHHFEYSIFEIYLRWTRLLFISFGYIKNARFQQRGAQDAGGKSKRDPYNVRKLGLRDRDRIEN